MKTLVKTNPEYKDKNWAKKTADWLNSLGDDWDSCNNGTMLLLDLRRGYLSEKFPIVIEDKE